MGFSGRSLSTGVHVLDIGAGSGLLSMMAARAGAESVVACEWHGSLAAAARRNVAANQLSQSVTVVQGDVAKLQRGKRGQGRYFAPKICIRIRIRVGLFIHSHSTLQKRRMTTEGIQYTRGVVLFTDLHRVYIHWW